jgi:uncharacterized protein
MKVGTAISSALLFYLVCSSLPAWADFAKGQEAYLLKDYAKAIQEYKNDDSPKAMFQLGRMYDHGEGVPQDPKEAAVWYRKAADLGHVRAQYQMGVAYANGFGVDQDMKEAAKWYKKSAGQGFLPAKEALKRIEKTNNPIK